ncbi:MAG: hypothetical protein DMG73_17290 [Acidobacteria bacterium]|nr:MAG: hypothetical protein DMG73_17290 [Acidobacteriota bacterium]
MHPALGEALHAPAPSDWSEAVTLDVRPSVVPNVARNVVPSSASRWPMAGCVRNLSHGSEAVVRPDSAPAECRQRARILPRADAGRWSQLKYWLESSHSVFFLAGAGLRGSLPAEFLVSGQV